MSSLCHWQPFHHDSVAHGVVDQHSAADLMPVIRSMSPSAFPPTILPLSLCMRVLCPVGPLPGACRIQKLRPLSLHESIADLMQLGIVVCLND